MTTIAYHHIDKHIAYDSRCTSNGLIVSDTFDKRLSVGKGTYFMSGSTSDFADFCKEFENGKKASRPYDCCALYVEDRIVRLRAVDADDNRFFEAAREFNFTIGTGQHLALAAMDLGKSAQAAVQYAATRDVYTGGQIKLFVID